MKNQKFYKQIFPMIIFILLILYIISFLTPLLWTLITSVKSKDDFILSKFGLPKKWMFSNYTTVLKELYLRLDSSGVKVYALKMIENSILYAIVSTVVATATHCFTAYAAARYSQYRIVRLLYSIVIVTMILPIVGNLPSTLQLMRAIGFYDNIFGLWIMKGSFLGTNFLIFYATFKSISWDYAEAAFVDGASHAKVLFLIMIPLARTTIIALMLLSFIGFWNDWQVNFIYLPSFPMIAYALYRFQNNTINEIAAVPFQLAACTFVMLIVLILFLAFRKQLMGNISLGGLKG